MPRKGSDPGTRVVNAAVGTVAAFGARKLATFLWRRITGKNPPAHPEDPQVALGEAIIWGVVLATSVHTAKMLATRAAHGRLTTSTPDAELPSGTE